LFLAGISNPEGAAILTWIYGKADHNQAGDKSGAQKSGIHRTKYVMRRENGASSNRRIYRIARFSPAMTA
jgi:hypothetical protein